MLGFCFLSTLSMSGVNSTMTVTLFLQGIAWCSLHVTVPCDGCGKNSCADAVIVQRVCDHNTHHHEYSLARMFVIRFADTSRLCSRFEYIVLTREYLRFLLPSLYHVRYQ